MAQPFRGLPCSSANNSRQSQNLRLTSFLKWSKSTNRTMMEDARTFLNTTTRVTTVIGVMEDTGLSDSLRRGRCGSLPISCCAPTMHSAPCLLRPPPCPAPSSWIRTCRRRTSTECDAGECGGHPAEFQLSPYPQEPKPTPREHAY